MSQSCQIDKVSLVQNLLNYKICSSTEERAKAPGQSGCNHIRERIGMFKELEKNHETALLEYGFTLLLGGLRSTL